LTPPAGGTMVMWMTFVVYGNQSSVISGRENSAMNMLLEHRKGTFILR
jgi:hypothetical protein